MVLMDKVHAAARIAATIPLIVPGSHGRFGILKPVTDLFFCLEHAPNDIPTALAAAKGMLETSSHLPLTKAMQGWAVLNLLVEAIEGDIHEGLRRQRDITAAYITAFRAATGEKATEA